MREGTEFFNAYRPDGTPIEVIYRHPWQETRDGQREQQEDLCVRHGFIMPTNSCAVSCIMAAVNAGRGE